MNNPLIESALPLYFRVENPKDVGISAPDIRHGDAHTTWVRSLTEMQKEAIVASARTGMVWRLASDEGEYLNGLDAAPAPLANFSAGMAASYMTEILAHAANKGVTINDITITQDNRYSMEGSMPKRTMIGGALPVDLEFEIDCDLKGDDLRAFVYDAVAASPLNGLLRGQLTSLFALALNGKEVQPDKVAPLPGGIGSDPGDQFSLVKPAMPKEQIVSKMGKSEPIGESKHTSGAASSLTDSQSRILHLRSICTLREGGMKQIDVHLLSPLGSMYRFLSDDAPIDGGQGRAPDANTYFSAGVGFCFMTQFGRFCKILKKQMRDYRIVQNTHISLGGASGKTGVPGSADPVETHVYLNSDEGEDFARDILDMSEQTCFLHALCRTDLKPKITIKG